MLTTNERLWLWILLAVLVLPWWAAACLIAGALIRDAWKARRPTKSKGAIPACIRHLHRTRLYAVK